MVQRDWMDIGCIQVGTEELLDREQALTELYRSCYDVFALEIFLPASLF